MAFPSMAPERAQRIKAAIEAALRDGFNAPGGALGRGSAVTEAARRLAEAGHAETRNSVAGFLRTQGNRQARGLDHYLPDWSLFSRPGVAPGEIRRGQVRRWLLTAAQDDTDVHPAFWRNLHAYAAHLGAEILVAGFTYQQVRHTDRLTLASTYRPELRDHLRFDPVDLGPVLFAAEMNTLPTAVKPLSGLMTYSRGRDAVFPHAKLSYQTVPQMPGAFVPSLMTTGACTVPNYVPKKAGLKAEFHHILGAALVEVDGDGRAFMRSISATADGAFQDLDARVVAGAVSLGHRVEAITWGDIHLPSVAPEIFDHLWGARADSAIEALRPRHQFFHDLLSFEQASRHVDGDPLHRARMVHRGLSGMQAHVAEGAAFLRATEREFCRSVMIESNHDDRLLQWARRDPDRRDVENVPYWQRGFSSRDLPAIGQRGARGRGGAGRGLQPAARHAAARGSAPARGNRIRADGGELRDLPGVGRHRMRHARAPRPERIPRHRCGPVAHGPADHDRRQAQPRDRRRRLCRRDDRRA